MLGLAYKVVAEYFERSRQLVLAGNPEFEPVRCESSYGIAEVGLLVGSYARASNCAEGAH